MSLVLQAVEVRGPGRWRWLLTHEDTGIPLADHEVAQYGVTRDRLAQIADTGRSEEHTSELQSQ